jgi:hypothetical protein
MKWILSSVVFLVPSRDSDNLWPRNARRGSNTIWNTTKRGKLSPVLDSNRRDYTYYQQMQKFKDILQKYL